MLRHLTIVALGVLLATAAYPCSGKYLGRSGVGVGAAVQPARILVLADPSAGKDSKILAMTLQQIGHRARHVASVQELLAVLGAGEEYDIVLVPVAEADPLAEKVAEASPESRFATFGRDVFSEEDAVAVDHPVIDLRMKSAQLRGQIQDLLTPSPEEPS